MPEGNSSRGTEDSRASEILAARAQIEAARQRQTRARPGVLPTLARYTILRELHRGGQGVVYLAVQDSTNRRVAVKILSRGPLGGDGLARFEREVEMLSLLKHPNVVMIHDCGRDAGHVYLVMDYVEGRALDAYVSGERPAVRELLDLFARVCDGVNAAHLRGVIHRDLKPGNIMVDNRGEPRVLDFGLAKMTGGAVPESAIAMTQTGQFVGSLPWASPEQALGQSEQLDIRTDVYSLGVVLYQLLTGKFPYPVSGNVVETVKQIAETAPARPSDVRPEIDRDLETILLKCLAKEPERRYQSAGDLARDLRRCLAGEPIEARRDSLAYVMARQVARYRVAAMGSAAVLAVVLLALAVSGVMWRRAAYERELARQSAAKAQLAAERADVEADQARATTEFLRGVLTSVDPEKQGADVRLVQVLADASHAASARLGEFPQQEASVRDLLGQVYDQLALWMEAAAEYGRAGELWRASAGPDDPRGLVSLAREASTLLNVSRTSEAEGVLLELVPRMERVFGPDDPRTLGAVRGLAIVHLQRGRVDEAEKMLLAQRAHPALATDDAAQAKILSGLVAVETSRLNALERPDQRLLLEKAERLAAEWVERSARSAGPTSLATLGARVKWADLTTGLGRRRAAVAQCRTILEGSAERLGECHHIRINAMLVLGEALGGLGEDAEAAEMRIQAIACLRQRVGVNGPVFVASGSDTLRYLERAGRAAEGEALARELSGVLRGLGAGHGDMGAQIEPFVPAFVSMQGRLEEAEALFGPLLAAEDGIEDARTRARLHVLYGAHLVRRGQFEQAERELQRAAAGIGDIRVGTWDTHPDDVIVAFVALYDAWGKPQRAEEYRAKREAIRRVREDEAG